MRFKSLFPEALFAIYDEISVEFCKKSDCQPNINIINAIFEGLNLFEDYKKNSDIADTASHLASSFLKEKPFFLQNDRMALIIMEVFLNINGYNLNASDPFFLINLRDLKAKELSEEDFAVWIRRHLQKKEVFA